MKMKSCADRRRVLREVIKKDPAIALIAGSILGPPPGLQVPDLPTGAAERESEGASNGTVS